MTHFWSMKICGNCFIQHMCCTEWVLGNGSPQSGTLSGVLSKHFINAYVQEVFAFPHGRIRAGYVLALIFTASQALFE